MEQLKMYDCEVCGETLGDDYAVLTMVAERETRYYFCSAACCFTSFIMMFMLMQNNTLLMRNLLTKAGLSVKDKKKK